MGLEQLSPEYQAQYNALIPEIERSVRSSNNARGMFYSGQATDAEARAKADLLAKLASESAATRATAQENAKNRATEMAINAESVKAGKRTALLNLLGGGTSAAATIAGLQYMHPQQIVPLGLGADGKMAYGTIGADGKSLIPLGAPGGAPAAALPGGGGAPGLDALSTAPYPGPYAPGMAPGAAATVAAQPSMWKTATALPNLGAGAAGGGLGFLAARAAGAKGLGADIGAGLGGAGGYMGGLALANSMGWSSPWTAGLGALAGSFGGGLLGNLFR